MKIYNLVKGHILKYKLKVTIFLILTVISTIFSIVTPYFAGKYFDIVLTISTDNLSKLYNFLGILILLWVAETINSFILNLHIAKLQNRIVLDFNISVLSHVKKLPILFFKNLDATYLNQRINSDSNTLIAYVLNTIVNLFIKIIIAFVILIILLNVTPKLTVVLCVLLPIYSLVYMLLKKPLYKTGYAYNENQNHFFANLNEQLLNIKFIKLNALFSYFNDKIIDKSNVLFKSLVKYCKFQYLFTSCDSFITKIWYILLYFFGGIEIVNKRISIGEFIIIRAYFSLLISAIRFFLQFGKEYQKTLVSYNRTMDILSMKPEHNGLLNIRSIDNIEIKNLSFGYDKNNKLLNNFSCSFSSGNIYCITGDNGAGKSTFINILLGLHMEEYDGSIYYNNKNIEGLDMYSIREKLIGISEQENVLIMDTIKGNITYGNDNLTNEDIDATIARFKIFDFLHLMTNGVEYRVNEKGANLSGGQRQRISQLRVIMKNSDLIIFDEPTSGLDTSGVREFELMINELKKDKIIIIVTHNEDLFLLADYVVNLT